MRSKQEFIDRWKDELSGLLVRAFADADCQGSLARANDDARRGRAMRQLLIDGNALLGRMYAVEEQPLNGAVKPAAGATR